MNTLLNKGKAIEVITPAAGYTSGQPVLVGSLVGISSNKYVQNDVAVIWLTGTHLVAKAAVAWNAGDMLYWDDTAKVFTNVVTANKFAGYAYQAQLAADATGYILLRQ